MTQTDQPNLGASLLRIHHVITRGLDVTREKSASFAQTGFPDASTKEGFLSYLRTYVSVLRAHHLGEDEVFFPSMREVLPDAPYDTLMAEHQVVEGILHTFSAEAAAIEAAAQPSAALESLHQTATRFFGLWHPHREKEERHFGVELLARLMAPEEHARLDAALAAHSQQHSGPDYLVVPFVLYNASPEERAIWAGLFPPVVTQQLVPIVWKEKWAPMQPFLLG